MLIFMQGDGSQSFLCKVSDTQEQTSAPWWDLDVLKPSEQPDVKQSAMKYVIERLNISSSITSEQNQLLQTLVPTDEGCVGFFKTQSLKNARIVRASFR